MRISLMIIAFLAFISVKAQTAFPGAGIGYLQQGALNHYNMLSDSNALQKKWSVSTYGGLGAGIGFFNGGNTAFFPAQIGVELNRRLNNNLYAFAGVAVTPVYFNFNRALNATGLHGNYMTAPAFNTNGLGIYQGIQAGLMYVNDAKTFSISGSIGVSNSRSPFYPASSINTQRHSALTGARQ